MKDSENPNQDLTTPNVPRVSNIWLLLGLGIGAILGLVAYTQHWIS